MKSREQLHAAGAAARPHSGVPIAGTAPAASHSPASPPPPETATPAAPATPGNLQNEAGLARELAKRLEQAAIDFSISIEDEALTHVLISAAGNAHFLAGLLEARARL